MFIRVRSSRLYALRYQHTQAIRAVLAERYRPSTANKMLAALRGVLQQAWRLGLIHGDDYHRAVDVESVRGETLPAGRQLSAGELAALFRVCGDDESPAGARDAAVLAILYGGGLRRSESVSLDLADFNREDGALRVRGKGSKERLCYATNGSRDAITCWLAVRGDEPGALFCPVNKGGRITIRRMSDQAILGLLKKRATQARVSTFSPHDCRRSFISHLLDAGADIATVQRLAGYSSVLITARYDRASARKGRLQRCYMSPT